MTEVLQELGLRLQYEQLKGQGLQKVLAMLVEDLYLYLEKGH